MPAIVSPVRRIVRPHTVPFTGGHWRYGGDRGSDFFPVLVTATPVTIAVQFAAYGFTGSLSGGDGGPYTIPSASLPADIEAAMTGDDTFEVTGNLAASGNPDLSITFGDGSGNIAVLEWSVAVSDSPELLVDRSGTPILDRAGNYILVREAA